MLIDLMIPLVESQGYTGGLQDFGAFVEGFCFKVQTAHVILREIPKANQELQSWIFCTDDAVKQTINDRQKNQN